MYYFKNMYTSPKDYALIFRDLRETITVILWIEVLPESFKT